MESPTFFCASFTKEHERCANTWFELSWQYARPNDDGPESQVSRQGSWESTLQHPIQTKGASFTQQCNPAVDSPKGVRKVESKLNHSSTPTACSLYGRHVSERGYLPTPEKRPCFPDNSRQDNRRPDHATRRFKFRVDEQQARSAEIICCLNANGTSISIG